MGAMCCRLPHSESEDSLAGEPVPMGTVRTSVGNSRGALVRSGTSSSTNKRMSGTAISANRAFGSDAYKDLDEEEGLLLSVPFFQNLDPRHAKDVASIFQRVEFSAGETIITEGERDSARVFNVILSGAVVISARRVDADAPPSAGGGVADALHAPHSHGETEQMMDDDDDDEKKAGKEVKGDADGVVPARAGTGEEVELAELGKGAWFGEIALVEENIQAVTVRASPRSEKTVVLSCGLDDFNAAVEEHESLRVAVVALGRMPPVQVQLRSIPIFAGVPELKLRQLAVLFDVRRFDVGELVCEQGEEADGFYYMASGRVDVSAKGPAGADVHLDSLRAGAWFGEIALLESVRRTASIRTTSESVMLYLRRDAFNRFLRLAPEIEASGVLQRIILQRTANSLKAIPLFKSFRTKRVGPLERFDEEKLAMLGALFRFVEAKEGDTVFREGDEGDSFFIIISGAVSVTASSPDGSPVNLGRLGSNEWFGEMSLLSESRRNATVTATENTVLLRLMQENFARFLQVAPETEATFRSLIGVRTAARLRDVPFFRGVRENKPWSKLDLLGGLFVFEDFLPRATVFNEGDVGNKFYILVEGEVEILVRKRLPRGEEKGDGDKKEDEEGELQVIDRLKSGAWFGEIALMSDTPRTASVRAVGSVTLLSLTAEKFQKFLDVAPELADPFEAMVSHRTANTLKTIDLFNLVKENKPWSKLELLGALFSYRQVKRGELVYSVGDSADFFWLLVRGRCSVYANDSSGAEVKVRDVVEENHFGETEIMYGTKQSTTVKAVKDCVFLVLTARHFRQFLDIAPEIKPYFAEAAIRHKDSLKVNDVEFEFSGNDAEEQQAAAKDVIEEEKDEEV